MLDREAKSFSGSERDRIRVPSGFLPHPSGDGPNEAEADADLLRGERKDMYEHVNRAINGLVFGRFAYFMNFGYVPNENTTYAAVSLRPGDFDVDSRRLVLEVLGDCPLQGKDVLDVSCGRGATAIILQEYFHPTSYLGVDLCAEAVKFCSERHLFDGFQFEEGDAESLPVEDASVDVVVNIEASHLYPRVTEFYREVSRVLRPGGWFQYTDILSPSVHECAVETLVGHGLEVTRNQDITDNVLTSCEDTAVRRVKVYKDENERAFMADFLAAPGSQLHSAMVDGSLSYRLYTFRKPDSS